MASLLGTSLPMFVLVTIFIIGFAAYMTGQALAATWKPIWHLLIYCALLGGAARFLIYALYQGDLWSVSGYIIGTAALVAIGLFAYRLTRARNIHGFTSGQGFFDGATESRRNHASRGHG